MPSVLAPSGETAWDASSPRRPRPGGLSEAEVEREYASSQSIARFVDPQEIADICTSWARRLRRMMSGQAIAVDGHTETYHIT